MGLWRVEQVPSNLHFSVSGIISPIRQVGSWHMEVLVEVLDGTAHQVMQPKCHSTF